MAKSSKPLKAFILAAGKGTRLRPYTDSVPKPMVEVGGVSIIKRTLNKLAAEGVEEVVVNLHHLADVLADHLQNVQQPHIVLSYETELLETGGGVKKALQHFAGEPFYLINGDALWDEGKDDSALTRLALTWDPASMDMLLLLQPVNGMSLTNGVGDYTLAADGHAIRALDKSGDYMFAGVRIVHPRLFEGSPDGAFSFLTLMDKAQQNGRLFGLAHTGAWHHISTPGELLRVDDAYRKGLAG